MKMISSALTSDGRSPQEREQDSQIQSGRITAINWLGISRKPSGKVAQYLRLKGFSETIIPLVLNSLQEDGYLDDESIARRLVRQRQGRKGESRAALVQRMQRYGLEDSAIENAMPDDTDDAADLAAARLLLEHRLGGQSKVLPQTGDEAEYQANLRSRYNLMQKTGRFLASRGFSQSIILRALRDFFPGIDSQD